MNRMGFLIGLPFGALLVLARFTSYDVIHAGLLLHNPTIYLVMASAVATALLLLWLLERGGWRTPLGGRLALQRLRVERKHVAGGLIFGTGWALAGTCPTVSAAQVASGWPLGLVVMAGLFCGVLLRDLQARHGRASLPGAGSRRLLGVRPHRWIPRSVIDENCRVR